MASKNRAAKSAAEAITNPDARVQTVPAAFVNHGYLSWRKGLVLLNLVRILGTGRSSPVMPSS